MLKFCAFSSRIKSFEIDIGYPIIFTDLIIRQYLYRLYACKDVISLAPKKQLVCVLLYFDKKLLQLSYCLVKIISKGLDCCEMKVAFRSSCKLKNLFRFKETLQRKVLLFSL